ncbi:MAG: hypothetical protein HQ518_01980 [Rhodopirellula sp.]|nr:hypothetical protein [Rhodopirellula sp.]
MQLTASCLPFRGVPGVPLCGGGVKSLLLSGDSEGLVVVPVVAWAGGSVGELGQSPVEVSAHAGAVQSVLDDETAGAFDRAPTAGCSARDRVAFTQVLAETHARAIVLEVRDR